MNEGLGPTARVKAPSIRAELVLGRVQSTVPRRKGVATTRCFSSSSPTACESVRQVSNSTTSRGEPVGFAFRDPRLVLPCDSRTEIFLPQPVIAEIEYGLASLQSSSRSSRLRDRFDVLLKELMRADWTDEVSRALGDIKAELERRGVRIEDFDVAVAAHAVALDATLVTGNVVHFERIRGLRLENWRRRASASRNPSSC